MKLKSMGMGALVAGVLSLGVLSESALAFQGVWNKRFTTNQNDSNSIVTGAKVAVYANQRVAMAGTFGRTSYSGYVNPASLGGPIVQKGSQDLLIAMYDTSGNFQWVRSFGDSTVISELLGIPCPVNESPYLENPALCEIDYPRSLAQEDVEDMVFDSQGNLIITGSFIGQHLDFGGGEINSIKGSGNTFLAKFSPNGQLLWSMGYPRSQSSGIAVDQQDNVIITGQHNGVNLGCGSLNSNGNSDLFLAKLSKGGNCIWSFSAGNNFGDYGSAVTVDANQNILLAGGFTSASLNFTNSPATLMVSNNPGYNQVFVAKFTSAGNYLWSKHFGSGHAKSIVTDSQGNVILSGVFGWGVIDFGGGALVNVVPPPPQPPTTDIFVAKLSGGGNYIWSKRFGGTGYEVPYGMSLRAYGMEVTKGPYDIYLTGTCQGGVMTPTPLSCNNNSLNDAFVMKLDSWGNFSTGQVYGNLYNQNGSDIVVSPSPSGPNLDSIYVTGTFKSYINFGVLPGGLTTDSGDDAFLAKLKP